MEQALVRSGDGIHPKGSLCESATGVMHSDPVGKRRGPSGRHSWLAVEDSTARSIGLFAMPTVIGSDQRRPSSRELADCRALAPVTARMVTQKFSHARIALLDQAMMRRMPGQPSTTLELLTSSSGYPFAVVLSSPRRSVKRNVFHVEQSIERRKGRESRKEKETRPCSTLPMMVELSSTCGPEGVCPLDFQQRQHGSNVMGSQ